MACPTLITSGFTLGHGTPLESSGNSTQGIALSQGYLYVHDKVTFKNGNVPGGADFVDEWGFSVFEYPSMTFVSHHPFGTLGDGEFYPTSFTADDSGNIYYWANEGPSTLTSLVEQTGDSWTALTQWAIDQPVHGTTWNPADGYLYSITTYDVSLDEIYLEVLDTSGSWIASTGKVETGTDYPVVTPDGAVWFSKGDNAGDSGLYRVTLSGTTFTIGSRDFDEIPPIRTDSVPVPQPDSSVIYRDHTNDRVIQMQSDFSWVELDPGCDPFTGSHGAQTARVAGHGNQVAFLFPTSGGIGTDLWDAFPVTGRWRTGRAGWAG